MSGRATAISAVLGEDCRWCGTGPLHETEYKGDTAICCPDCGTPALRLF